MLTKESEDVILKTVELRDRGCVNHEYAGRCVQAQRKTEEREERRKDRYPAGLLLGHGVKNHMTVI